MRQPPFHPLSSIGIAATATAAAVAAVAATVAKENNTTSRTVTSIAATNVIFFCSTVSSRFRFVLVFHRFSRSDYPLTSFC